MKSWRLEARVISIGNNCDWSFTKPPQMKRMCICTATGAVQHMRTEKNVWARFWDFFFFMMSRLFFSMYIFTYAQKKARSIPGLRQHCKLVKIDALDPSQASGSRVGALILSSAIAVLTMLVLNVLRADLISQLCK
jgi:hypothetical protein